MNHNTLKETINLLLDLDLLKKSDKEKVMQGFLTIEEKNYLNFSLSTEEENAIMNKVKNNH